MARRRSGDVRPTRRGVARSTRGGSRIPWAVAAFVVAAMAYGGTMWTRRAAAAASLPALPELTGQPASVGTHLGEKLAAAQQHPTSREEVAALCLAYHADLFYEQADRCYARLAALDPSEWRWIYYRALLQNERGGGDAFAATLRRVLEIAPDFGPAWLRLGDAEFKDGHYDRAAAAWNRAVTLPEPTRAGDSPPHPADVPIAAYASLGLARIALADNQPEQARQILQRITMQAPRFGSAFRLLAESDTVLGRAGDADRAINRANHLPPFAPYADPMVDALARESRNSTFLLRQASDADLSTNAAWSEYLTRRALESDPNNPDVVSKLARTLRTLGRSEEALVFFTRYSKMVPDDFQALGQIGSCLSDLGRFDEAEPFLRRAHQQLDDALTHYNLGALLSATGRLDEAVVEYQHALNRDPADPDARSNLAAVLVKQGKLARATEELARALTIDPENANAHTNLGLVLAQQGQLERAVREFRTALRIDPRITQAAEALRQLGIKN
jgi:tetratricopeptide (TPR) repeat protein